MKLCLGTVQFGLDYGISNKRGKVLQEEIEKILTFSHDNGIVMIDTAYAYGNSEFVLGEAIAKIGKSFHVITKYPATTDIRPFQWIDTSLKQLKTEKLYGYLFHNYSVFKEHPEYIEDFQRIKQCDKCEKIGFSLYYPSEAEYIMKNNIPCDVVQVPYNIFDQRFADLFVDLKNHGIDIYVRSIFLQGLFFIDPDNLDNRFDAIKNLLKEIYQLANDNLLNVATLCLGFVNLSREVEYTVIGIDSLSTLKKNVRNYTLLEKINIPYSCFERFAVNDESIILPFNWQK